MTDAAMVDASARMLAIARGLAERFDRLLRSVDRLDALEERSGAITSEELRADPRARAGVAHELVARLVRAAADPGLEELVRSLVRNGPRRAGELAEEAGASRFVIGRRVADLVDVGLAERDPGPDLVSATRLGAALVDLLDELEAATEREMRIHLERGEP